MGSKLALLVLLVPVLAVAEGVQLNSGDMIPNDKPLMQPVLGGAVEIASFDLDTGVQSSVSVLVPKGASIVTEAGVAQFDANLQELTTRAVTAEATAKSAVEQNQACQEKPSGGMSITAIGTIFAVGVSVGAVVAGVAILSIRQ